MKTDRFKMTSTYKVMSYLVMRKRTRTRTRMIMRTVTRMIMRTVTMTKKMKIMGKMKRKKKVQLRHSLKKN